MWAYRIYKRRETADGAPESHEAGLARLHALPGVVAVEACPDMVELAGAVYVSAPDMTDERAALLIENPRALPGTVTLHWVDAGLDAHGAIADHLRDDLRALHSCADRIQSEAQRDAARQLMGLGRSHGAA